MKGEGELQRRILIYHKKEKMQGTNNMPANEKERLKSSLTFPFMGERRRGWTRNHLCRPKKGATLLLVNLATSEKGRNKEKFVWKGKTGEETYEGAVVGTDEVGYCSEEKGKRREGE